MNLNKYPPVTLPPLVGRPAFPVMVRTRLPHIDIDMADRQQGKLLGQVDGEMAYARWIKGTGGGRGTYLMGVFVQEAITHGAHAFSARAVHPGTLAIFTTLFGKDNLNFSVYGKGARLVPFGGDYMDVMEELIQYRKDIEAKNHVIHQTISITASLLDPATRQHLLGP